MEHAVPLENLTWVSGSFRAHVLAARLEFEGIDVELRGPLDGPYLLTVGDLARIDVLVPADQMDDARLVLLAGEVDAALAAPGEWAGPRPARRWARPAACVALVSAALAPVALYVAR